MGLSRHRWARSRWMVCLGSRLLCSKVDWGFRLQRWLGGGKWPCRLGSAFAYPRRAGQCNVHSVLIQVLQWTWGSVSLWSQDAAQLQIHLGRGLCHVLREHQRIGRDPCYTRQYWYDGHAKLVLLSLVGQHGRMARSNLWLTLFIILTEKTFNY